MTVIVGVKMKFRRSEKKLRPDSSRTRAVFSVAQVHHFREVGELPFIQCTVQSCQFDSDVLKCCQSLLHATVEEKFLLE